MQINIKITAILDGGLDKLLIFATRNVFNKIAYNEKNNSFRLFLVSDGGL